MPDGRLPQNLQQLRVKLYAQDRDDDDNVEGNRGPIDVEASIIRPTTAVAIIVKTIVTTTKASALRYIGQERVFGG